MSYLETCYELTSIYFNNYKFSDLLNLKVPIKVILTVYRSCVSNLDIKKIEKLDNNEKVLLVNQCLNYVKKDNENFVDVCRCLHLFNNINSK